MPFVLFVLALQLAAACASEPDNGHRASDPPPLAGIDFPPMPAPGDRDGDGLCDVTEDRIGSDPDERDTDRDGYLDASELIAGFDWTDPLAPELDQVGFLAAEDGATLSLAIRSTVDGAGQGVTGQFNARNSFDARARRASDYLVDAQALWAEPPDNVRGMDAQDEHFGRVIGKTRLSFSLRFAYASDDVLACAAALPFEYGVKSDYGGYLTTRYYLLVVTPDTPHAGPPAADDYCRPAACL